MGFKLGARFEKVEHTDDGVRVTLEGGDTLEAGGAARLRRTRPDLSGPGL